MTSSRTLITANAGCGKTFNLANRVIGWMVQQHRLHDDIGIDGLLAATFTRKAAGEILEGILLHLAKAVLDDEALKGYRDTMALEPPATQLDCAAVLDALCRNLHRMQVGTLDAFFGKLAGACAGEAGLPAGWRIGTSEAMESLRREAIDDLLDGCSPEDLAGIVLAAEESVLKGMAQDGIVEAVWKSGILTLWRHTLNTNAREAWRWLLVQTIDTVFPLASELSDEALASTLKAVKDAPLPMKKEGTPNGNWVNAVSGLLGKASTGDWAGVLESKMAKAMVGVGQFRKVDAPEALAKAGTPLVGHAIDVLAQRLQRRMEGWMSLVGDAEACMTIRQRDAGLYNFNDIALHLARTSLLSNVSDQWLQFRLDTTLRDIALDEFQDTSLEQFQVLEPVLKEIFAGSGSHEDERKLLVVADAKQSIYGWRGGTPALLAELRAMGGGALDVQTLQRSYRSAPPLMDFVNRVFRDIANNDSLNHLEDSPVEAGVLDTAGLGVCATELGPVATALSRWPWSTHESAHADMAGGVQVHVPSWDSDQKERDRRAFQLVVEIVEARLGHAESIGVLLTRNKDVSDLAAQLRLAGIDVSEEGKGSIKSLPAVDAVLQMLHLAEHPGDRSSAFLLSHSPLSDWLGLPPLESIPQESQQEAMTRAALHVRTCVHRDGLEAVLAHLAELVRSKCDARNAEALLHVVRLAGAWQGLTPRRLCDFVQHVRQAKIESVTGGRVRVMTIHSAKGLEFDEVILPLLDAPFIKEDSGCLSVFDGPLGELVAVAPSVNKELRWTAPALEVFRHQSLASIVADRLSGLYVALTRARQGLHLILQNHEKDISQYCTAANIIRAALPDLHNKVADAPKDATTLAWSLDQGKWLTAKVSSERVEPDVNVPVMLSSGKQPDEPQPSQLAIEVVSGRPRRDGIALHECLAMVEWVEDGLPASFDAAFTRAALQTGRPMGAKLRAGIADRLNHAMAGPVGDAMKRSACAHWEVDQLEVLPEVALWSDHGEQRIDRLVLGSIDGRVVRAAVLDFKSGITDPELALEQYQDQLDRYVDLVCDTWGLEPDAVEASLLLIDA